MLVALFNGSTCNLHWYLTEILEIKLLVCETLTDTQGLSPGIKRLQSNVNVSHEGGQKRQKQKERILTALNQAARQRFAFKNGCCLST